MGIDKSGGAFFAVLLVVAVVVGAIVLFADLLDRGVAETTRAQSELSYARADQTRAETEQTRVEADVFERRVILYSLTMAAWMGGLDLVDVALLVLVLVLVAVGGYAFGLRRDDGPWR